MPASSPERFELDPALRKQCEDAILEGPSHFLASLLLPTQIRLATRALYAPFAVLPMIWSVRQQSVRRGRGIEITA
ncbi:MAG: hypothetical protein R3D34_09165 [Nitratireductor sp.]